MGAPALPRSTSGMSAAAAAAGAIELKASHEGLDGGPDSAEYQLACADWLNKRGGTFKSWKKRWFAISKDTPGTLTYFENETQKEKIDSIALRGSMVTLHNW